MGIFQKIRLTWKSMPTTEKVNMVIDAIVDVGCGLASMKVGKKLTEDCNIAEKIFIRTAVAGAGLAVSNSAAKALEDTYGVAITNVIDRTKAKTQEAREQENEEEAANE